MNHSARSSVWLVVAMLLGAALTGRTVLDSELPSWAMLGVGILAGVGCLWLRAGGKIRQGMGAQIWSLTIAAAIAGLTFWYGGRTQVSTLWTGLAFGCLGWVWCRTLLAKGVELDALSRLLALLAASIIACQVAGDELLDYPAMLMRSVSFGLVLLAIGLWLVDGENSSAASRSASLMAPVLVCIGVVLALLWSAALEPSKGLASRLGMRFMDDADVVKLEDFAPDTPAATSFDGTSGEGGRSLPRRADIQLSNALRAMIRVKDREQFQQMIRQPIYLRTLSLSVIMSEGDLAPLRLGEWRYDADDGEGDGKVDVGPLANDGRAPVEHTIYIESSQSSALPVLAGVKRFGLNEVYEYADDWYQLALPEGQEMVAYHALSDFHRVAQGTVFPEDWKVAEPESDDYVQMPDNNLAKKLAASLAELGVAEENATEESLAKRLERVRQFLQQRCEYSLAYENPDDLPPVENFLYGEKLGHCELFAVTTVMLLRSQGIPSRVAYGFSGGSAQMKKRSIAFRDRDFHAWAEVLVEGRGWVIFDTTPEGAGANSAAGSGSGMRFGTGIPDFSDYQLLQGNADELLVRKSLVPRWLQTVLDFASLYLTEICVTALGGFLAVWLVRVARLRWLARQRGGGGRFGGMGAASAAAAPSYLEGFLHLWAERGVVRRPGQTIREFVDRLKAEQRCNGEFDELLRYLYAVRYSGATRDQRTEAALRRQVNDFSRRPEAVDDE